MKRTDKDFTEYVLIDESTEYYTKYILKHKDYSYAHSVSFLTIDNKMIVGGDYGNWLFGVGFAPEPKNEIDSESYVIEKLEMKSTQKGYVYSEEITKKNINDWFEDDLEKEDHIKQLMDNAYSEDALYEEVFNLGYGYEELDYFKGVELHPKLKYVFDYFDEICKRLEK